MKTIKDEFSTIVDQTTLNKAFKYPKLNKDFSKVIQDILNDLKSNQQALSILSDIVTYDNYIFTHSLNVTVYTLRLAMELNFNEKQLGEIGLGAILHDVGKMMLPLDILNKPDRLTDPEFKIIQSHTNEGFEYLRKQHDIPLLVAHCAFQHHERLDGSGYPRGIMKNEIHEYAKIIAIADVFDAVTSHRVYRKAMLPNEALELLYAGAGTQFDQSLVEAFRRVVALYPEGLSVTLSDGREGIVIKQNKQLTTHPIVRIISEDGKDLLECYDLDLSKQLDVTIVKMESILANTV
ncbi:HD-GYP domain-containing protein [Bacillus sp. JCM 19034]|uniref:HD-GYP domain-containing protein n=1 Tax=Bacillus sp. JCM 19034 TaxID=1481928 RepID=UPI000B10A514